jgi:hypothetical protein
VTSCRLTSRHSSTLDGKALCIEPKDKEPSPSRQLNCHCVKRGQRLDSAEHASLKSITTSSIRALHGSPSTGLPTPSAQVTVFHDFLLRSNKGACARLTESQTSFPAESWQRPQSRARNSDRGKSSRNGENTSPRRERRLISSRARTARMHGQDKPNQPTTLSSPGVTGMKAATTRIWLCRCELSS